MKTALYENKFEKTLNQRKLVRPRGGARHFYLGGPLEGPVLQQGELSMVCVGLSERDLLQWHDVTRKIFGGPGKILGGQLAPLAPP